MSQDLEKVAAEREQLLAAQRKGTGAKLWVYTRMSGPGWLQSAITLGGGSLASSLYLGVVAGYAFMWVQPVAMLLGIVMLSGIAYVTLSTGERPFRAINQHVSPVLGWSWALAALAANMFWCLPQYALATSVLEQNLLPEYLAANGPLQTSVAGVLGSDHWITLHAGKLVVVGSILLLTTLITWSYDSGRWGIKLYEWILKLMVAGIVLCFFGVIWKLGQAGQLAWGEIAFGFLPDLSKLWEPSDRFLVALENSGHAETWKQVIVGEQREILISAAATAVGINMTFLFPYSLLAKGWRREFRGLAIFDLSTGMLIPFVLATSCVVIAAANRFHTETVAGFLNETDDNGQAIVPPDTARREFYDLLTPILKAEIGDDAFQALLDAELPLETALTTLPEAEQERLNPETVATFRAELGRAAVETRIAELPESERRIAAMLIRRSPFDLAKSLTPLTGDRVGNLVFGLGVLGMTLSTITLLMLISGFVIVEIFGLPSRGWAHRLGCLAAATGVLGPFIWNRASFYLAVYVSVFGMMLLPIAYLSFLFLMNRGTLLGRDMPRGGRRVLWNSLLLLAAGVATFASVYSVWQRTKWNGIYAIFVLLGLAVMVQIGRWLRPRRNATVRNDQPPQ